MEDILDTLVTILGILCTIALPIGFGMYLGLNSIRSKHQERMELIKQGIVPPDKTSKPTPNKFRSLRNGMLCIGIAVGILLSVVLCNTINIDMNDWGFLLVGGCVLLFLGIAYLLFYILVKNKDIDSEIE